MTNFRRIQAQKAPLGRPGRFFGQTLGWWLDPGAPLGYPACHVVPFV